MKFLSAGMDPELSGKKKLSENGHKMVLWLFLFAAGAWQRCPCWLLYTNWGNSCKKYPTLPCLCRSGDGAGGVTDLKKHLKNSWFGAVQVCEVTPEKPQPWGQQHTQGQV